MKRKNKIIPTLIALTAACATSQSLQAQAPARQAFPWSSSSVAQTASPVVSQTVSRVLSTTSFDAEARAETFSNPISQLSDTSIIDNTSFDSTTGSATTIANNALSVGETVYLDEQGNEITRDQMQAKLSAGQNEMISTLPSASGSVQSLEQNLGQDFQQRITPLRSVDNSAWGKAKSVTSQATPFWKKPSLFKTPEGMTLPSMKTTWAKPKFDQPTTWFSRKTTSPITFASIDSLPRKGKTPTSIDGPGNLSQSATDRLPKSFTPDGQNSGSAQSIFQAAGDRVASEFSVGNDFEPIR